MATIEINNVSKFFDETTAVDNVSISVLDGEFLALVGPSGCGKSTLLRMISGLETIDEGEIIIDGTKINDTPAKERDIAMVFQNYALYPHMSVYDNLAFGLKMKGMNKDDIDTKVQHVAHLLDIGELLERMPKQLSGGQKQRIAVGRAIVRDPKAFLFDEPLSNLDAKLRVKMRSDLLRLHKKQNATSVYVTHDQVEAMTMADRIAIINKGVVQQIDTPINVYLNPANLFVATFIGSPSMNFLDGSIQSSNGTYVFESDSKLISIELAQELLESIPQESYENIVIGIRPEDLLLHKENVDDIQFQQTPVELVEQMGDVSLIYISVEKDHEWTIKAPPTEDIKINQPISPYLKSDKIYFFDRSTGANLGYS